MRVLRVILQILVEVWYSICYFFANNLRNFATIIQIALPYLCLFLGQSVYKDRGYFAIGGELFLPALGMFIVYFIRQFANKIGKGTSIPRPSERFTEVSEDGEVNIEVDRLQELTLYMADLEDWMERKGLL